MTNVKNKIAIIIALIVVIALVASFAITFNNEENVNIVEAASFTQGQNGEVTTDYTSPYASISGAYAISDVTTFENFLTAAQTASEGSPVYGYLTASFESSNALKGSLMQYAHLDGCGYTITLTNSATNTFDASNYMDSTVTIANLAHYSGYKTPFGYATDSDKTGFYSSGYFAGLSKFSEIKNLTMNYSGTFRWDNNSQMNRALSMGIMFGYAYGTNIDNCALNMTGTMYFYMQSSKGGGDYESVASLCLGGFTGVFDAYNTTASFSNSLVNLAPGSYIEGHSKGNQSGLLQRNSARAFVGGMTGALCNGAKMFNLTAQGSGAVRAYGHSPTWQSGNDRITYSGVICGSNISETDGSVYSTHNHTGSCGSGTINGIICSWAGESALDYGSYYSSKYGDGNTGDHEYVGMVVGAAASGTVSNLYYTTSQAAYTEMADSSHLDSGYGFKSIGVGCEIAPNFVDLTLYDLATGTYKNSTLGTYNSTLYCYDNQNNDLIKLIWTDLTIGANLKVEFDVTKHELYTDDSGMIVWNFSMTEANNAVTAVNANCYELATSVQNAFDNYRTYITENPITRTNTSMAITVKADFGFAVKYQLDSADSASVDFGTRAYNTNSGCGSTPTIQLYTLNGSNWTRFNMPDSLVTSKISESASATTYTSSDIWTVYNAGSYNVHDLSYVKDAGNYEFMVYNGVTTASSAAKKFDFCDTANKIVAYKVDNSQYNASVSEKWQPKYTYKITPTQISGNWTTISNTVDSETYSVPQDFTYWAGNTNFTYAVPASQFLQTSDVSEITMTYYNVKYTAVAAADVQSSVEYYALVDGNYVYQGKPASDTFGTYDVYYRQILTLNSNIKNAGMYKVVISKCANTNYVLPESLQKEYYLNVAQRMVKVNYSGLTGIEYDADPHQASYAVVNKDGSTIFDKSSDSVTFANANIVVSNVLDSAAIVVTYTTGNNYVAVGTYTVEISVASGVNNYLLPDTTANILSSDGENIEDVTSFDYLTDSTIVSKIVRTIEIHKVTLKLAVQYNAGQYKSSINGRQYEELATIGTYTQAKVFVNSAVVDTYIVEEEYTGYNSLMCALIGVPLGDGVYEHVYCTYNYYVATLNAIENRYEIADVNADALKMVETQGVYIAEISFRTATYTNYDNKTFYMVFKVDGIIATFSKDTSGLSATTVYTGLDQSESYSDFVTVAGVRTADIEQKGYKVSFEFYIADATYTAEDKIVKNEITYKPVDSVVNTGKYLSVATNNISTVNYTLQYDSSCTADNLYYEFEVTPLSLTISVTADEKVYGTEFDDEIGYEITDGAILDGDAVTIGFTSTGYAEDANVGKYAIVAACTGASAGNYTYVVDGANKFEVKPLALTLSVGNVSKTYGEVFSAATLTPTLTGTTQVYGDDDISYSFASDGFVATAGVDQYDITCEVTGTDGANYTATVTGVLTVNAKALTLTSVTPASNLVYDGTAKAVVVVFAGVVNDDSLVATVEYNEDANVSPIKVGSYTAIVTGVTNENYSYTASTEADATFSITAKEVKVSISDITMGYGDTKLTATGDGYTCVDGTSFVSGDVVEFTFTTLEATTMASNPGNYSHVVTATLGGADGANYTLNVTIYGNLTIGAKALNTLSLVNNSKVYTGENLISQILVDTTGSQYSMEVKANEQVVTSVVNAGEYEVVITGDGTYYETGSTTLTFTVEKADIDVATITVDDLTLFYNKVKVAGDYASAAMTVSKDGVTYTNTNTITGLTAMTRYNIYIIISESANYNASEAVRLSFTTTYDPNAINDAIEEIGENFGFNKVNAYKLAVANYAKVSAGDKATVDSDAYEAAQARYTTLMASAATVVEAAQTTAAKAAGVNFVALGATSLSGFAVIGLAAGIIMKKKKDKVKSKKNINGKKVAVTALIVMLIIAMACTLIACDGDNTTISGGTKTKAADFYKAAGSIGDSTLTLVVKQDLTVVYSYNDGDVSNQFGLDVDEGTYSGSGTGYTYTANSFKNGKINEYESTDSAVLTADIADPNTFLGITGTISNAKITIEMSMSKVLHTIKITYTMTSSDVAYDVAITLTASASETETTTTTPGGFEE